VTEILVSGGEARCWKTCIAVDHDLTRSTIVGYRSKAAIRAYVISVNGLGATSLENNRG
jgi:hypothetical protein